MAGGELSGASPYLQGRPCPKCGYVRTTADANPAWQCPKCLIAYLKYRAPGGEQLHTRLVAGGREMAGDAKSDHSLLALIVANLMALGIARVTGMSLHDLMLVYWIQSVIIGLCAFVRIASLRNFSTEGFRIDDEPIEETAMNKWRVAIFFLLHYGFFHFGYLIFIAFDNRDPMPPRSWGPYVLCALIFAVNHGYSLLRNIRLDARGETNIRTLMMLPYFRILPMHLTILAGGTMAGAPGILFWVFGALKILADCIMHTVEHHVLGRGSLLPPAEPEPPNA
jgi:hypothetical protein